MENEEIVENEITLETDNNYGLEHSWEIRGLRKTDINGLSSVITSVDWTLSGTDINGNTGEFLGETTFPISEVNSNKFSVYEQLNKEDVVQWIVEHINTIGGYWRNINEFILDEIRKNTNPIVEVDNLHLPWSPPIEEVDETDTDNETEEIE
jgi:hypothetical protein